MAIVEITPLLQEEIFKKFKQESIEIFQLMRTLEKSPHKGKPLAQVGGIVLKEIKYKKFRFYFITDDNKLKFASSSELSSLLIKFVKMSEKRDQQKVIQEIKQVLRKIGPTGF